VAGLDILVLHVGMAVARSACQLWLKDDTVSEASGSVADMLERHGSGMLERRRLTRQFDQFAETVADKLHPMCGHEFRGLPEHERKAAIGAVADAFDAARLSYPKLFEQDLDPQRVERTIRLAAPRRAERAGLSMDGTALYDRVLREACEYVVEIATNLPAFQTAALAELLRRETALAEMVRQILDRLPERRASSGEAGFEVAYRRQVERTLDRIELYGVTVSDASRRYPLSVAYLSLTVAFPTLPSPGEDAPGQRAEEPSAAGGRLDVVPAPVALVPPAAVPAGGPYIGGTGQMWEWLGDGVRMEQVLGAARRLFVRGEAGSGKTTLLQWLAVSSARRSFEEELGTYNALVPFFLPLRRYAGAELPPPEHFLDAVAGPIAGELPAGWVQQLLRTGRALVLVDGVDELPAEERERARAWLRMLLAAFPEAHYVVTSRPSAAHEQWLDQDGFLSLEIQAMSPADVAAFIRHWHDAVRSETADVGDRALLDEYERELARAVVSRRHLRALATNPLLCALLCALNRDRRSQLPGSRMELYEVALEMLLDRRDSERRITTDGVDMSRTEKTLILQDLAYWLIRNGRSDAAVDRAISQVGQRLRSMPQVHADPKRTFDYLLSRSGLIREPVHGRVDFVHRTFQEYLAARAAVHADDIGALVDRAHDDQWREVVVMAAGHAHPRQRDELLSGVLCRAEEEAEHQTRLRLLAVACLETCPELEYAVRAEIEASAERLLPPRTAEDVKTLTAAGDFVLDLLAQTELRTRRQALATVRTAAQIGGERALPVLARVGKQSDDPAVLAEIVKMWPRFNPVEYARTVLADWHGTTAVVDDPAMIPGLPHLPRLESLVCRFSEGRGDYRFLLGLPRLIRLTVHRDPLLRDLTPISEHPALSTLVLEAYQPGMNLAVLRYTPHLERLALGQLGAGASMEVLSSLPKLRALRLTKARFSGPTPLGVLRGIEELSELTLHRCDLRIINGIERWRDTLVTLDLSGCQQLRHIGPVGALRALRELNLSSTRILDLAPLASVPTLRRLVVGGRPIVDLSPLAAAPDLTVVLDPDQQVLGADLLGTGVHLERRRPDGRAR
jgi:hypothetical protein